MPSSDSKTEKIQTHFQALSSVAPTLNAASDELTRAVTTLDEALKKLNIGVTAWVSFRSRGVANDEYDDDQIGYGKVDGKWGIALRTIWGDLTLENFGGDGPWLFNDAPRELRLLAVDKIPELIEALGKEAFNTTKKVQEKTKQVLELTSVIEKMAKEPSRTERSKKAGKRTAAGLSSEELTAILAGVQHQQKFVGELLEGTSRWVLNPSGLQIYFPADKQPFAEMLKGREALSKVSAVVREVLGYPVQVVVKLEPPLIDVSTAGNDKGSK